MPLLAVIAAAVVIVTVYTSLFEWTYHRYWLHRPWLPPQMFTAHTLIHHQLCKHDDTFHVHEEEQEEALTFQWWSLPVILAINQAPFVLAWLLLGDRIAAFHPGAFILTGSAVVVAYYFSYEGFHYLMHKPSIPWLEKSAPFRFIERHHRMHHAHMGKNFNVVLPLADWMLGTLIMHDPLAPRVTEPAAKQIARRYSRYGRQLRAQEASAPAMNGAKPAGTTTEAEREADLVTQDS